MYNPREITDQKFGYFKLTENDFKKSVIFAQFKIVKILVIFSTKVKIDN